MAEHLAFKNHTRLLRHFLWNYIRTREPYLLPITLDRNTIGQ